MAHQRSLPSDAATAMPVDAMAELLPDGLVVVGADQVIRFVNTEALRVLGAARDDLLGRPVREALPLADKAGHDWWAHTDPWDGLPTRTGHREKLLVGPDGRDLLVTARYARTERGGRLERVLVGLRDAQARQRAERDSATVLATVAHELRAPLTSVAGFTNSLLRRWDRFTDEQKRLMIETIQSDASRLTRLIGELLDISRLDADRLALRRGPVDLEDLLRRHVVRHELSRKGQLTLRLGRRAREEGVPELWADADRLEQVFFNLIENASLHGGGNITVTLERDGGEPAGVVVHVDDTGDGVLPEDRERVFDRFWHGADTTTTGLGLYVVRGFVEAHDGTVSVGESDSGGARFTVRLPASIPDFLPDRA
ncbi:MAG: ATP-binding protein [Intrasporangium sp.]|uniref:sensor histidine kinase n=1 Tax=Intrasporangium sp. TaxID=1925024 RepID=UPI0026494345|nr:ATP-binding protein [Intrasporangium sp.]MDN5796361.1 ATP-binding protein [Intrasporangium sp.]